MQEDGSFSIVPDIETDMGAASVVCVTTAACKFGGSSRFPTDAAEEADADADGDAAEAGGGEPAAEEEEELLLGCV